VRTGNPGPFSRTLSPFESEIAALARAGYTKSGIAAALGIAPGTVKAVLRDIRRKLGPNWRETLLPGGPGEEGAAADDEAQPWLSAVPAGPQASATAEGTQDPSAGWEPAGSAATERYEREAREGRRLAALLLVRSQGRPVLKVSGSQRFFLRPLLAALEAEGCLRLFATDRHDVFDPPWLAIVNRGRRAVRAAAYLVRDEARVRAALEQYLEAGLVDYVESLIERVAATRGLMARWRRGNLPTSAEIWDRVREAFGGGGKSNQV